MFHCRQLCVATRGGPHRGARATAEPRLIAAEAGAQGSVLQQVGEGHYPTVAHSGGVSIYRIAQVCMIGRAAIYADLLCDPLSSAALD